MSINYNAVILAGNLTRDPELKSLPSGTEVCNFSLATNESYTNKQGEKVEKAEFHSIICFAKLAATVAQYLTKGQSVLVEGKLQTRSWEGKDGEKRYKTEVLASSVQFGPKRTPGASQEAKTGYVDDDGVPPNEEKAPIAKKKPVTKVEYPDKIEYPTEDISPEDIPF